MDVLTDNMLHNTRTEVNIAWKIVLSSGVSIKESTVVGVKKKTFSVFLFEFISLCLL